MNSVQRFEFNSLDEFNGVLTRLSSCIPSQARGLSRHEKRLLNLVQPHVRDGVVDLVSLTHGRSSKQINTLKHRIKNLIASGALAASLPTVDSPKENYQEASKYLHLIDECLRLRKPPKINGGRLVFIWHAFLEPDEARQLATTALARAVVRFKPPYDKRLYLRAKIWSAIADEVRQRIRRNARVKFEELPENLPTPSPRNVPEIPNALERIYTWHSQGHLTHQQAVVLAMHYVHDHSILEISRVLGVSPSLVFHRRKEALEQLKLLLEKTREDSRNSLFDR